MSFFRSQWSSLAGARVVVLVILACVAADVASARQGQPGRRPAAARMAPDRGARQAERAQQRAMQRPPQERPVEAAPSAPLSAPSFPPPAVQPPQERARPGRLTPDERRALRQQINEAGREIYRPERP